MLPTYNIFHSMCCSQFRHRRAVYITKAWFANTDYIPFFYYLYMCGSMLYGFSFAWYVSLQAAILPAYSISNNQYFIVIFRCGDFIK